MLGFIACEKSEQDKTQDKVQDTNAIKQEIDVEQIEKILGREINFIERGKFVVDSLSEVVAGTEFSSDSLWGIRFTLLKNDGNSIKKVYQTNVLDGSFKEGLIDKLRLKGINYDLIYYDSRDYYMGSGGGEIFSYLIDFQTESVYKAHFFTVPDKPVSLFISSNTTDDNIRNFFISKYRKDYPELQLVKKDYKLEDIF